MTKILHSSNNPLNPIYVAGLAVQTLWWLGKKVLRYESQQDTRLSTRAMENWSPSIQEPVPEISVPKINNVVFPVVLPSPQVDVPPVTVQSNQTAIKTTFGQELLTNLVEPTAKTVIALLPIAAMLLKGKEKELRNVEIKISAEMEPKLYKVALGNDFNEINFKFEVEAGKTISFFGGKGENNSETTLPQLFKPEQISFGPFSIDRVEKFTKCDIIIEDYLNPELLARPKIFVISNSNEMIRIIQRHPLKRAEAIKTRKGDPSRFKKLFAAAVDTNNIGEDKVTYVAINKQDYLQVGKFSTSLVPFR